MMKNWQLGFVHVLLSGLPGKKIVPNKFQLTTTISLMYMSGQDTLVDVGTGYGKTLHDHTFSSVLSWVNLNHNIASQAITGCSSAGI